MSTTAYNLIITTCDKMLKLKVEDNVAEIRELTSVYLADGRKDYAGFCNVLQNDRIKACEDHIMNLDVVTVAMIVKKFNAQWPDYSCDPIFPIPHPSANCTDAFINSNFKEMWVEGSYAHMRWAYIEDLKTYCENQLEKL